MINKSIEVSNAAAALLHAKLHSKFLVIQDSNPGLLVLEQKERLVIFSQGKFKHHCSREGKGRVRKNELQGSEEEKYFNETMTGTCFHGSVNSCRVNLACEKAPFWGLSHKRRSHES